MVKGLVALATATIDAPTAAVWDALVNPETIRRYMFGTTVVSEWKRGAPIFWKGVWKGKSYEDKGTILDLKREQVISYSHFSPLSRLPDAPENYHVVTVKLQSDGRRTTVTLSQDGNSTEEARDHSRKNWEMMLASLKDLLETGQ